MIYCIRQNAPVACCSKVNKFLVGFLSRDKHCITYKSLQRLLRNSSLNRCKSDSSIKKIQYNDYYHSEKRI